MAGSDDDDREPAINHQDPHSRRGNRQAYISEVPVTFVFTFPFRFLFINECITKSYGGLMVTSLSLDRH